MESYKAPESHYEQDSSKLNKNYVHSQNLPTELTDPEIKSVPSVGGSGFYGMSGSGSLVRNSFRRTLFTSPAKQSSSVSRDINTRAFVNSDGTPLKVGEKEVVVVVGKVKYLEKDFSKDKVSGHYMALLQEEESKDIYMKVGTHAVNVPNKKGELIQTDLIDSKKDWVGNEFKHQRTTQAARKLTEAQIKSGDFEKAPQLLEDVTKKVIASLIEDHSKGKII